MNSYTKIDSMYTCVDTNKQVETAKAKVNNQPQGFQSALRAFPAINGSINTRA